MSVARLGGRLERSGQWRLTNITLNIVKPAAATPGGPAVFAIVKDENYFLPFFFDHYRALGVELFLIYDDRSGPATVDYLMQQADCVILDPTAPLAIRSARTSSASRAETAAGAEGTGSRVVSARPMGADRRRRRVSGPALGLLEPARVHRLAGARRAALCDGADGRLLRRDSGPAELSARLDPFAGNPYFDAGPYYYWTGPVWPFRLSGSVRFRLLKCCANSTSSASATSSAALPPLGKSWKVPLLKHGCGVVRKADHEISVAPRATDLSAALAHFKFYPDLDAKIEHCAAGEAVLRGSAEYSFLKPAMELFGRESRDRPRDAALRRTRSPSSRRGCCSERAGDSRAGMMSDDMTLTSYFSDHGRRALNSWPKKSWIARARGLLVAPGQSPKWARFSVQSRFGANRSSRSTSRSVMPAECVCFSASSSS